MSFCGHRRPVLSSGPPEGTNQRPDPPLLPSRPHRPARLHWALLHYKSQLSTAAAASGAAGTEMDANEGDRDVVVTTEHPAHNTCLQTLATLKHSFFFFPIYVFTPPSPLK